MDDENNDISVLNNKIEEQQHLINDLNSQIHDLKKIDSNNKEYFIFLEMENYNLNAEVKKLKKENDSILSSVSWKITRPCRYVVNLFRKLLK